MKLTEAFRGVLHSFREHVPAGQPGADQRHCAERAAPDRDRYHRQYHFRPHGRVAALEWPELWFNATNTAKFASSTANIQGPAAGQFSLPATRGSFSLL